MVHPCNVVHNLRSGQTDFGPGSEWRRYGVCVKTAGYGGGSNKVMRN
jgi:hypothetical protein